MAVNLEDDGTVGGFAGIETDDPEGILFDEEQMIAGLVKSLNFALSRKDRLIARKAKLGYIDQPIYDAMERKKIGELSGTSE